MTPGRWRPGGASRWWLNGSLAALDRDLRQRGGRLCLRKGSAPEVLKAVLTETGASALHAARGYEPWEAELKRSVTALCKAQGAAFRTYGGLPEAIRTGGGNPPRMFTPFWRPCLAAGSPRAPLPAPRPPASRTPRAILLPR